VIATNDVKQVSAPIRAQYRYAGQYVPHYLQLVTIGNASLRTHRRSASHSDR